MRRELENAGFGSITFSSGTYLVVEAEKVRTVIESPKKLELVKDEVALSNKHRDSETVHAPN